MKSFSFFLSMLLLGLLFPFTGQAQIDPFAFGYYQDALRFSEVYRGGTARFRGIAGAGVALGGDISSANINPAGLGFMRRSELSVSLSLMGANAETTYSLPNVDGAQDYIMDNTRLNANFPNIGLAIHIPSSGRSNFMGGTFAVNVSRLQNFQRRLGYEGINGDNSLIDYLLETTNGTPWSVMDDQGLGIYDVQGLGYFTYLTNPDPEDESATQYYSFVPVSDHRQQETFITKGATYQWDISYGGNVADKFFFGLGLGVRTVNYEQEKTYTETPLDQTQALRSFTLTEDLDISGTGVNFNLGFIYRPTYAVRFAASLTTPTYVRLNDTYAASMIAEYNSVEITDPNGQTNILGTESAETDILTSTYALTTPMRARGGVAFFFGKAGFLSADVEYTDYSGANLSNPDPVFSFAGDNNTTKQLYRPTVNLRVGGEVRSGVMRFRGGFGWFPSPYQPEFDSENARNRMLISGGLGVRMREYYLDFAVQHFSTNSTYTPYTLNDAKNPITQTNEGYLNLIFTFGIPF